MTAEIHIQILANEGEATFGVTADTVQEAIRIATARALASFNVTAASFAPDAPKAAHTQPVNPPASPVPGIYTPANKEREIAEAAATGPQHEYHVIKAVEFEDANPPSAPKYVESEVDHDNWDQAQAALDIERQSPAPVLTAQENAQTPPWEQQAVEGVDPSLSRSEKKSGRRTNEELAADAGVKLDDVKAWLGAGKRVTKKAIEEYAAQLPQAEIQPYVDQIEQGVQEIAAATQTPPFPIQPEGLPYESAPAPPFQPAEVEPFVGEAFPTPQPDAEQPAWNPFDGEQPGKLPF